MPTTGHKITIRNNRNSLTTIYPLLFIGATCACQDYGTSTSTFIIVIIIGRVAFRVSCVPEVEIETMVEQNQQKRIVVTDSVDLIITANCVH